MITEHTTRRPVIQVIHAFLRHGWKLSGLNLPGTLSFVKGSAAVWVYHNKRETTIRLST